ncbi:MAG TPA: sigma-54-dependent Fis family transcriptional regulator [Ignavibacteria bacterium]|nr:sigma-54-dependent Fis family transcriptional regulator [Ignavibacteria bacterium]
MSKIILAIDDDVVFLRSLKKILTMNGFNVEICSNPINALKLIKTNYYSCIVTDVKMPGMNGLEIQKEISQEKPGLPVIAISGQSNISIAVEMIKNGAYDFIEKPVDEEKLLLSINNAIEKQCLTEEKDNLFNELSENYRMIGKSKPFNEILEKINVIAPTDARVLITGETGVGKELVAWAIHHNSKRKNKPYLRINCAAIPNELLGSELFGHKKGSFTGAINDRIGKFVEADGGTLLLDEIGDLGVSLQSKLLRTLEENEIEMIGENNLRKINVRIIVATNKDLEKEIKNNRFRLDLFHRINVFEIAVPPLRNRIEDIIPITRFYLEKFCSTYNKRIRNINSQVEGLLLNRLWKGNVRELRNLVEKLVLYSNKDIITVDDYYKATANNNPNIIEGKTFKEAKSLFEKELLLDTLQKCDWKVVEAAKELGIERTNLFKKMQKYNLKK